MCHCVFADTPEGKVAPFAIATIEKPAIHPYLTLPGMRGK
jgi:hypothetical protein